MTDEPTPRPSRKKRRADGTLRPAVLRRRRRKHRERDAGKRAEWLAQFAPGARDRFFNHVRLDEAVYLAAFQRASGLDGPEAVAALERLATERRWRKLRTLDGTVVGIAPPRASGRRAWNATLWVEDTESTDRRVIAVGAVSWPVEGVPLVSPTGERLGRVTGFRRADGRVRGLILTDRLADGLEGQPVAVEVALERYEIRDAAGEVVNPLLGSDDSILVVQKATLRSVALCLPPVVPAFPDARIDP